MSPIPSARSVPIPTADFTRPSSPSPASVTPRCNGNCIPSCSIATTNRRIVSTIITVFDALIEITTLRKFCATHTRRNSIADSTMPAGVSPYRLMMRSDNEPWLTPMRIAVLFLRQRSINGTNVASIFFISSAYSSSV